MYSSRVPFCTQWGGAARRPPWRRPRWRPHERHGLAGLLLEGQAGAHLSSSCCRARRSTRSSSSSCSSQWQCDRHPCSSRRQCSGPRSRPPSCCPSRCSGSSQRCSTGSGLAVDGRSLQHLAGPSRHCSSTSTSSHTGLRCNAPRHSSTSSRTTRLRTLGAALPAAERRQGQPRFSSTMAMLRRRAVPSESDILVLACG